jgi:2-phosphosulfolactate phosphatase
LCAGCIIEELHRQSYSPIQLNDLGIVLHQAVSQCLDSIPDMMRISSGGRRLEKLGRVHDISYCSQLNLLDCVPEMGEGNRMVPYQGIRGEKIFKLL